VPKPYQVSMARGLFLACGLCIPLGPQQGIPPKLSLPAMQLSSLRHCIHCLSQLQPAQGLEFDLLAKLQPVIPRSVARLVFQPLGFVGIRGCIQHHFLGRA
jgi:hypothetical protein